MNKKLYWCIISFLSLLIGSNIYVISICGFIPYEEIHTGYTYNKNVIWGGTGEEGSVYSTNDSQKNLIVTCFSQSYSASENIYVIKYRGDLKQYWNASWSHEDNTRPAGIITDKNNNIYVTGTINRTLSGSKYIQNVFVLKFNVNGTIVWDTIREENNSTEIASSIVIDSKGFLFISGRTNSSNGEMFIHKYTSSGTYQSTFFYGNTDPRESLEIGGMKIDEKGNLFIAATTNNTITGNNQDLVLVKMNSTTGIAYWNTTFGGISSDDRGIDIELSNGYTYLTGHYVNDTNPQELDIVVLQINATTGIIQWKASLNFANDLVGGITVNRFGNPVVAGTTNNFVPSRNDVLVVEFNQTGSLLWNGTYQSATNKNITDTIAYDKNLFIVGTVYNTTTLTNNVIIVAFNDKSHFLYPEQGPYGKIFGIIMGIIVCVFSLTMISALLYTHWKK